MLQPLLQEILNENFRERCLNELVPQFWSHFWSCMLSDPETVLSSFVEAVDQLKQTVEATSYTASIVGTLPGAHTDSSPMGGLLRILRLSLSVSQPPSFYPLVEEVFGLSVRAWEETQKEGDSAMEDVSTDSSESMHVNEGKGRRSEGEGQWKLFSKLVSDLQSLKLLHFFADHAVGRVVHNKVKSLVSESCSEVFDSPLLEGVISSLESVVLSWLQEVYGHSEGVEVQWLPQIHQSGYKTFAEMRISELFDILVEYPDSEPALQDLKICLEKVNIRGHLITSLKQSFECRLLHPGANTADIITQYISSIKGLRLLDPSGVVLEQVCDPVRAYLHSREDTVRCIVASLTDDSNNELADELATGEPVLVDLNEDSDSEEQDFDSWQPDPVDADPTKTSKSRQTSDIISLLVNIYGSQEMFVNEYRSLLADRILQSLSYDTSREVRNLELLKLRFGESNLHFCEVMIKDVADSKRINGHVVSKMRQLKLEERKTEEESEPCTGVEVNAFILSHVFWPTFREEKLKLPDVVHKALEDYCKGFQSLKGMRTLQWKPHLGLVQVDIQLSDRELSFNVSPIRAAIIYNFQEKSTWTVDALSSALEAHPSSIRKHLGFWVGQGVLKEQSTDTFTAVEEQHEAQHDADVEDTEEESAMATAEQQKESELQVFWSYIVGMLTNLGMMPLERIHSMLKMFAMQGIAAGGKEFTQAELKIFLDRKVREQQLTLAGGVYQLPGTDQ